MKFGERPFLWFLCLNGCFKFKDAVHIPGNVCKYFGSGGQHFSDRVSGRIRHIIKPAARAAGYLLTDLTKIYSPGCCRVRLGKIKHFSDEILKVGRAAPYADCSTIFQIVQHEQFEKLFDIDFSLIFLHFCPAVQHEQFEKLFDILAQRTPPFFWKIFILLFNLSDYNKTCLLTQYKFGPNTPDNLNI
jgi:hypothetical protein